MFVHNYMLMNYFFGLSPNNLLFSRRYVYFINYGDLVRNFVRYFICYVYILGVGCKSAEER